MKLWATLKLERLLNWVQANSLHFVHVSTGCCADEWTETIGARYDLERFGAVEEPDPAKADLLVISGAINYDSAAALKALYEEMPHPKYVMALGACACSGGALSPEYSYCVLPGVDRILPVDVYVPGCPPRPEAIMNGLLALQDKMYGYGRTR